MPSSTGRRARRSWVRSNARKTDRKVYFCGPSWSLSRISNSSRSTNAIWYEKVRISYQNGKYCTNSVIVILAMCSISNSGWVLWFRSLRDIQFARTITIIAGKIAMSTSAALLEAWVGSRTRHDTPMRFNTKKYVIRIWIANIVRNQ